MAERASDKFTVALTKARRRGRIFLDFLRNQRTATAIMPYSARARTGMPVAAPVGWEELKEIDRADAFTVADVELLLKRASSPSPSGGENALNRCRTWVDAPKAVAERARDG